MKKPKTITYKGITASPEEWAKMVGVNFYTFKQQAERLRSWEKACHLEPYKKQHGLNKHDSI